MFAVYASHAAPDDPLSALKLGDLPEPGAPTGWVRVKVSRASLNRHDLFTLIGRSGHRRRHGGRHLPSDGRKDSLSGYASNEASHPARILVGRVDRFERYCPLALKPN